LDSKQPSLYLKVKLFQIHDIIQNSSTENWYQIRLNYWTLILSKLLGTNDVKIDTTAFMCSSWLSEPFGSNPINEIKQQCLLIFDLKQEQGPNKTLQLIQHYFSYCESTRSSNQCSADVWRRLVHSLRPQSQQNTVSLFALSANTIVEEENTDLVIDKQYIASNCVLENCSLSS
jgi:hypothetical protein